MKEFTLCEWTFFVLGKMKDGMNENDIIKEVQSTAVSVKSPSTNFPSSFTTYFTTIEGATKFVKEIGEVKSSDCLGLNFDLLEFLKHDSSRILNLNNL